MMMHHTKSWINSLLTAGRHKITPAHILINTLTRNFHLGSKNLSSKKRKARFLVERERTEFLDDRSCHALATNSFVSGLCNRAIMIKINIPGRAIFFTPTLRWRTVDREGLVTIKLKMWYWG